MDSSAGAGYSATWTTEGTSGEQTVTETEWLKCNDPWQMFRLVYDQPGMIRRKAGRRKLRLLGVACCRMLGRLMPDSRSLAAIEMAERLADGRASQEEVSLAEEEASQASHDAWQSYFDSPKVAPECLVRPHQAASWAAQLLNRQAGNFSVAGLCHSLPWDRDAPDYEAYQERRLRQANVLRCVFGNPFHPLTISPAILAWNNATIVCLAQAAYDERHLPAGTLGNGRLAVLADALEEAGCTDADILGHLREPGPHVRGCWPVDLCLGKS